MQQTGGVGAGGWTRRRVLLAALLLLVLGAPSVGPLAGVPERARPAVRPGSGPGAQPDGLPGVPDTRVVMQDGRAYVLHVPPALRRDPRLSRGSPVMLVLHGLDSNPADAAASTGLSRLADRDDALVAYPEGVRDSFNAGYCCGPAVVHQVDDVSFLARVVQDLRRRGAGRVSVVGFSNGGMMAYRLACERPGLVDTVGVMSGTLEIPRCDGRITALHLHGDRDTAVPFEGDDSSARLGTFLRDVRTIEAASPGSSITVRRLQRWEHRWQQQGHPVDASEEFWAFARMSERP